MSGASLEIPSYRSVFDLERRIHRIDRFRVPLPYGLPLRSVAYALVTLGLVLALGRLPGWGAVIHSAPAPIRLVLLPVAASCALTRVRIDGRNAHTAAMAWARHRMAPKRLAAFTPMRTDESLDAWELTLVIERPEVPA